MVFNTRNRSGKAHAGRFLPGCDCATVGSSVVLEEIAAEAEVVCNDVTLTRGGKPVLQRVQLSVMRGETIALVGRSGAGKSSLLKLMNRVLVPDSGRVLVRGKATIEWDPIALRRQTGYVLQETGLFPHLSVRENVAVVPRLLGWPPQRIEQRVVELLSLVELIPDEYASRRPDELSGGERQRVGVARALAADPPLLLMDEPFGALDPITRSDLHKQFRRIQQTLRKTVVMVTHDMAEAFTLADRIAVLEKGQIIAVDNPKGILGSTNPAVRRMLAPLLEVNEAIRGRS
jgi:osmoprotectant transport system ATP-binding protein